MKFGPFARVAALGLAFGTTLFDNASAEELSLNSDLASRVEGLGEPEALINWRDNLGDPTNQYDSANVYSNVGMLLLVDADTFFIEASCSGTLINSRTFMSAAHCVRPSSGVPSYDRTLAVMSFSPDTFNDFIVTGDYHVGTSHVVPTGYDPFAFYVDNDISLIALSQPVFDVPYATLATSVFAGPVTTVGYGVFGTGSNPSFDSDFRRRSATNILEDYGYLDFASETPVVVGDFEDPNDPTGTDFWGVDQTVTTREGVPAPGDSGGPLFDQFGDVVGVASGAFTGNDFGYGTGSFWTSVPDLLPFIDANNPLRFALDDLGNGAWENPGHWVAGFVPDNSTHAGDDPFAIADYTIARHYYEVELSGSGVTTLTSSVEIDKLDMYLSGTELNIAAAGSLDVWSDVGVFFNSVLRVNGNLEVLLDDYGVFLANGGKLMGTGAVNARVDNFSGVVAPGNSIGTIQFQNGFTQGVAGLLQIEMTAGSADLVAVTGNASLNGTVQFLPFGPNPLAGQSNTFLTTTGTVSGHFSTVQDSLPGSLYPIVTYGSNFARVTVATFCTFASGPVQTPVCGALNDPSVQGDPDMAAALAGLQQLDSASLPGALESLNPTRAHAQTMVGLMSGDLLRNQFTRRGNDLLGGGEGSSQTAVLFDISRTQIASADATADMLASAAAAALADGENGGSSYDLPNGYGLYFAGDVAIAETDQAGGIGTDDADIAVVTAGVDRNEGTGFIFGAALSFMQSTVAQNYGYGGDTSSDGAALSVYGDMRRGRFTANGFLSAGFHSFDTERRLLVAPMTFATATGSTEASQFQAAAHGSFNVSHHRYTGFDLVGGVGYMSVDIDGYSEAGAGALNAVLAGRTVDSLITQLGGELTLYPDVDDGQLLPVVRVIWNHEFMDDPYVISTGFAGAPATTFTTPGPDLGSDWATVGLGVKGRVSASTSFVFRYELDVGRDGQDRQEVSAAARVAF